MKANNTHDDSAPTVVITPGRAVALEFVGDDVGQQNINTISHSRIENLQKSVACHRAAFDFDMGFILQSVQLVAGFDLEHEVENGPPKKKRGRKKNLT
jgi:hypothetical protein